MAPLFFGSYAGLNLGMAQYAQDLADGEQSSNEWLVGLKLTGPNWIFKNFMVDMNLNFHYGPPKFFETFTNEASGYLIQADITFPFELARYSRSSLYAGVGPLLSAYKFDFRYLGKDRTSSSVSLGALLMAGFAYDLGGWAVRIEPKYYFEKSSYLVFLAGIQKRF